MSRRSFVTVERSFPAEVEDAFGFLTVEFGLSDAQHDSLVIPSVSYAGPGIRYEVMLATDDRAVITKVRVEGGGTRQTADLDRLAHAAGLSSPNQVRSSASTLHALRNVLQAQAELVRRLHPQLTSPSATALMERAGAKTWSGG